MTKMSPKRQTQFTNKYMIMINLRIISKGGEIKWIYELSLLFGQRETNLRCKQK